MTVRTILSIGHPVLREVAVDVPVDDIGSATIQGLIDDLIDTMRHANGAGLAATQVGERVRIAVMEVTNNPRYPYKPPIPLTIAINPVIEPIDDELVEINEGCLSVPLRGNVQRNVNIRVRYLDRDGVEHDEVKRGLTAGTWQHECDHLDGVLFIDRVTDRVDAGDVGRVREVPTRRVRRTDHRVRRTGRLVTWASSTYFWCELALDRRTPAAVGGDRGGRRSVRFDHRGRRTDGRTRSGSPASRSPASPTPTATRSIARCARGPRPIGARSGRGAS